MGLKYNKKKPNKDEFFYKKNYPKNREKMIKIKFDIKGCN